MRTQNVSVNEIVFSTLFVQLPYNFSCACIHPHFGFVTRGKEAIAVTRLENSGKWVSTRPSVCSWWDEGGVEWRGEESAHGLSIHDSTFPATPSLVTF
jgi:hypothetical protein